VQRDGAPPVFVASGRSLADERLTADTIVYTASLSKQITAACAALLVQEGRLDIESTLAQCSSFVIIALDDDEDRTAVLATAMIKELGGMLST
jgi:hypothetical protein